MKIKPKYYLLTVLLLIIYGCSNTRYLNDGEMLYTGAEVKVEDTVMTRRERKDMEANMEELARPKTNRKILGLRVKLYIYNIAGEPKKDSGFRYWLRNKVGEPPVLFSQVDLDYNADVLQNHAENNGYFKARVSADSTSSGKKKVEAVYTVTPKQQYKIRNVIFPSDSSLTRLDSAVAKTKRRTRLRKGRPYDLDVVKDERDRIDERLKQKGYYYFNPDYILVKVDSTVGDHQVDMRVIVKDEAPEKAKRQYTINNIYIFPNYSLNDTRDTINVKNIVKDSVQQYKDFTIIDPQNTFKPIIYDRTLYFHKGDLYNRTDHNLSLSRLISLGTFRFVKNEFRVSDSLENSLDAYYYLTPMPKKSIRTELSAKTNSANYTGSDLTVNWSNRNTFRAAELLSLSVYGGFEVQMAGQNKGYNVYRVGSEVSLVWPRFITPFRVEAPSAFVPKTRALVNYEFQKRIHLYALNSFKAQFSYLWKESTTKEHLLNVFDVNYVSPNSVSDEYQQMANNNPSIQRVIDKQFIFGPSYSYTFTNTMRKYKRHTVYYKGSLELAGTIFGLAGGANVKKGDTITFLNVPFSQYAKTEHEFRYFMRLGRDSKIATRAIVGIGVPYGNSSELPYVKQFFSGGTNSLRAFRARSVGPGSYYPEDIDPNSFVPDESGDIKLELNAEYRAKLYSVIHGAVFVDAGNVWLWNSNEENPGGKFTSDFMSQLAVGTGLGLRLDLDFLVLRLDGAFPIRKPWLPAGNRWVIDDVDFGSKTWRKDNLVFNLAIGYPF
ncbi:BamA/TamA family outer membrane protein [Flavobacterium alkalisoli]|uniref:BamA/TamA family outer membrane protein n=1 Tax=Flavobacterium alkalisoli TaxID=2602769 RepID=A0A5B9FSY8_9FLAO|nr:BamA/TamA family outer membrane protein [Flavobacterium alkalisoli]QEE50463.1 BamA/TamA family outer membrane protein [Flavobacterium alkalisoli]